MTDQLVHDQPEERYEVLEGEVTVHVDGRPRLLGAGERWSSPRHPVSSSVCSFPSSPTSSEAIEPNPGRGLE